MDPLPKINYCTAIAIAPEKGDKSQLYYTFIPHTDTLPNSPWQIFSKYLAKVCPPFAHSTLRSLLPDYNLYDPHIWKSDDQK